MTKVVHKYTRGTGEIVGFEAPWRLDVYRPNDPDPRTPWLNAVTERKMATGPNDVSPAHAIYPSGYDAACSCCWLNIQHTEDMHARKTGKSR